ncbi:cell division protein ZapA [Permianibacter sp. IMCC34836]|uniref:cell division protein ZapA n=1 Tax=Permianibacter fluminis TaxID=2738515 RepID=UPI00155691A1|nr:cell division protein ZapA [Permianibacter fluminis]NQD35560.1 cell division protein ZapA [Permianibacter fluminis]
MSNVLNLRLLDRELKVACPPEQQQELLEAARQLDGRMREIRDVGKVAGVEKIALMVALNLAHELLQLQQAGNAGAELTDRLRRMQEKIDDSLKATRQLELG